MDPELREYLEAMEQRLAAKADLGDMRQDIIGLKVGQERLEAHIDAQVGSLRGDLAGVEARIDAQGRDIREAMTAMETRLTKSIENRREDIDAIGADVLDLQSRVKRLDRPRTKPK